MKSKTVIITAIVIILVAAAAFFGYKVYQRSQLQDGFERGGRSNQSEGNETEIPQGGDLCGGTGGIGEIISLGNQTFTIRRKDGRNLIVNLTSNSTIETSTGSASLSDLKTGDSVTLVGGPNPDESFSADTVIVCNGTG